MSKRLFPFIMSLFVIFNLIMFSSSAAAPPIEDVDLNINGERFVLDSDYAYFDDELDAYVISFSIDAGSIHYYDSEEYVPDESTISSMSLGPISDEIISRNTGFWRFFRETSEKRVSGPRQKVSADYVAPPLGGSVTRTITRSSESSFSAGLSWTDKSLITASATFQWCDSASTSTEYTFNVGSGQSGYIAFTPYYMRVSGYMQDFVDATLIDETFAFGQSVLLTDDGEPDGRVEFIFY